ncbi:DUF4407 domain-containing protein [Actinoplanes sp. RD1]|uniref:DUF4407 domain-containing protein n=1 Tax=Actinoplanes sp. RD1 TaxID=3064538 RepID=UPI002740E070|nr:DUF4407 domain-containing protein [Actinoplanes sp. RD1]
MTGPDEWSAVFDRAKPGRPVPPDRGPARTVRIMAGVREELLDWVPEERPRYTRLGLIVFNTGVLAALSLFAALHKIADAPWILLLPVVAIWALLVMTFDGWLVASTHGVLGWAKWGVFFPRLIISILMGAAIAEPLVLWVFQPAITKEVLAGRQTELDEVESRWTLCNPASGERGSAAGCAGYQLSLPSSPQSARDQQDRLKAQRDAVQASVDRINGTIDELQALARDECSGNSGRGLTGRRGEGPNCRQLRADVQTYRRVNGLESKQGELARLNTQIVALDTTIKNAADGYAGQVAGAIEKKVAAKEAGQKDVGLLEEMAALDRLAEKEPVVFAAHWLLRLLLIAIDCMPLLVKAIGGATQYDHIVAEQLLANAAMRTKAVAFQEKSFEQRRRAGVEELEAGDRAIRARRRADTRTSVDALFQKLYTPPHRPRRSPTDETTVPTPRRPLGPPSDPWEEHVNGSPH